MSYLNSSRLNLGALRDVSRSELFSLLDAIEGTKSMIWDAKLVAPFGLISDYGQLKQHNVVQMLELRGGKLPPSISAQNLIYFMRPELPFIDIIAENIRSESESHRLNSINLHIIFVPRRCALCERKLQAVGVFGDFASITDYSPDFYVFDSDLVSIESPNCFRECALERDYASLHQAARSLMTMQCLFGVIPAVTGIGRSAKSVYDIMIRMRREMGAIEPTIVPQIDHLWLIDRSVDTLSPMLVQQTYEGMLDELFGIKQTMIELPGEKFAQNNSSNGEDLESGGGMSTATLEPRTERKRFYLNSSEELFKRLRDASHLSVGPILLSSAKRLAAQFDERKLAKTVREIRQFVDRIPTLQRSRQSQANHTTMAELIREHTNREEFQEYLYYENELLNCGDVETCKAYIESCISRSEDLARVLRLISIQSFCTNGGLRAKQWDFYKREIVQTYGYEHMRTLETLERAGLILTAANLPDSARSYSIVRTRLKLTWNVNAQSSASAASASSSGGGNNNNNNNNNNNSSPDIAHVYHGYTPLAARLIQHYEQFGFRSLADLLERYLFGRPSSVPLFDETQPLPIAARKRGGGAQSGDYTGDSVSLQSAAEAGQKLILVFFIGGCTLAEISALRLFAAKGAAANADFVIATTSIINGRSLLGSICEMEFDSPH